MNTQQIKTMFSTGNDIWETPQYLYDELNKEFKFTLDAAALPENAKCDKYFTPDDNALSKSWTGHTVFVNPPYSRKLQYEFVKKAKEESDKGTTIVMLLPARTDTKIFHEVILPFAEIRFIKGRLKFGGAKFNAPFPSMLAIFKKNENKTPQENKTQI
jgi:site-specific DNA-methyltransferase (adenine-specific)